MHSCMACADSVLRGAYSSYFLVFVVGYCDRLLGLGIHRRFNPELLVLCHYKARLVGNETSISFIMMRFDALHRSQ